MKIKKIKLDKEGYQIGMKDLNGEKLSDQVVPISDEEQARLGIPAADEVLRGIRSRPRRGTSTRLERKHVLPVRAQLHLSQKDFALLVGVTPAAIRNWEQGRSAVPVMAQKLFRVMEKRPEVIKDLTEVNPPDGTSP